MIIKCIHYNVTGNQHNLSYKSQDNIRTQSKITHMRISINKPTVHEP